MKRRYALAGMALMVMSSAQAANVVLSLPGDSFAPGEVFTMDVDAFDFPNTGGATLGLVFDAAVVDIDSASDFRLNGSPFTGSLTATENGPGDWTVSLLAPLLGPDPFGDFKVFEVDFTAGQAGITTIELVDEETPLKGWFDSNFNVITGVTYNLPEVRVVAVPSAIWMMLGGLGFFWLRVREPR